MEPFRSESLKYCTFFTLVIGIILLYTGVWSLDTSYTADKILVSSLSSFIWFACIFFLGGWALSTILAKRSTVIGSWVLSLSAFAAITSINIGLSNPFGAIGFLLPVLYAAFTLEWKHNILLTGLILVTAAYINTNAFQESIFPPDVFFPIFIVFLVSFFLQLIFNNYYSNLTWYQNKYLFAIKNEQIIRENEIKLERLIKSLNEYQKFLRTTNDLLITARDEAESAKKAKQIFVQNVSHELRTPLNLIIGFSETMVNLPGNYGDVNWTPYLRGDIECIYQNSQHLKALIDDVLDLAAMESHKYEIDPENIDLISLIHEVTAITELPFSSKGLFLKVAAGDDNLMVYADTVRLKQVFLNLLTNALNFTKTGGVSITIQKDRDWAMVSIQDTGKGIPKDTLEQVFEAFYQVDKSNNRENTGTGLGLSISKQLIELHKGEMKIASKLGQGTTVSFTLPLSKELD